MKIKYIAWLQGFIYLMTFLAAPLTAGLLVLASIGNYFLFFGRDLLGKGSNFKRRLGAKKKQNQQTKTPRHVCHVCGINSNTHPDADFRYCSQCDGQYAYCQDHLRNHPHVNKNAMK